MSINKTNSGIWIKFQKYELLSNEITQINLQITVLKSEITLKI